MSNINLILGGANTGINPSCGFKSVEELEPLLELWKNSGLKILDTSALYPWTNIGTSEKLIGEAKAAEIGFAIDTKIMPGGAGCLKPEAIHTSFTKSLDSLRVNKVRVLYCHSPDYETPLKEIAETFDLLYKQGKFEMWGVSNFPASMVEELVKICKENGLIPPKFYQGQYNAINRMVEGELIPVLRANNIAFNAYSTLAGGFFTGNLAKGDEAVMGTRYQRGNKSGDHQRKIYEKQEMFDAYGILQKVIEPLQISGTEAALRWVVYHSVLQDGDGVVLGASKVSQMEKTLTDIKKGPLPDEVVEAIEKMWSIVEPVAPKYYM